MRSVTAGTHPDGPAVLVDNLFANPETKTGPDRTFSREEWLKDMLPRVRADAFAVISYSYSDAAVAIVKLRAIRHPQLNCAFLVNGVQAVSQEIGKYLPQLARHSGDLDVSIPLLLDHGVLRFDPAL